MEKSRVSNKHFSKVLGKVIDVLLGYTFISTESIFYFIKRPSNFIPRKRNKFEKQNFEILGYYLESFIYFKFFTELFFLFHLKDITVASNIKSEVH